MFAHRPLSCIPRSIIVPAILLLLASAAQARPRSDLAQRVADDLRIRGGTTSALKAAEDTILVLGPLGSGAPHPGGFEGDSGGPAWNGWTSVDLTVLANHWHVDAYRAVSGSYSAWCGENLPSCYLTDPDGGYGNNYDDSLEWRGSVADPGLPCTVSVSALANHDTEPGYDYIHLMVETAGGELTLWSMDGTANAVSLGGSHVYQPGDYVGPSGDEVVVYFRVTSDGDQSDADCSWYTAGAIQLDDLTVTLDNGTGASHDFEDGTLGPFALRSVPTVGDFAQIWSGLEDYDPCATNYSPQVAFIDDGVVVPGTGGAPCLNWCYGPNGWIVNTTGGLAGPDFHLHNAVVSPVMAWPGPGFDAALFEFDVYRHEDLSLDSPGVFYTWDIRSSTSAAGIGDAPWQDRGRVGWGGPEYFRERQVVSDLLVPGCTHVQVQLAVWEFGWVWGYVGNDGYPAPYFDNVRLAATRQHGPELAAYEMDLAQDGFPASGSFDPANPAAASVRFDMAADISWASHEWIDPGDSVVFSAAIVRTGAVMVGDPRMHYRLKANPAFDAYRSSSLPAVGSVACMPVFAAPGVPVPGRWAADLPDEGFLFPGDVLHYCFAASDEVGGDIQTATLPADTSGFSNFGSRWSFDPGPYDRRFTVRALPSIHDFSAQYGSADQPDLLFWFDGGSDEDWTAWKWAIYQTCLVAGWDFDVFTTRAASSGVGNGLGAKATVDLLSRYETVLYSSGDLSRNTLGAGSGFADPSPDLQLLSSWLDLGGKGLYAGGDGLATSLLESAEGAGFLEQRLGIDCVNQDIRPLINNQHSPRVEFVPGEPLGWEIDTWQLAGGCPQVRQFDAVLATGAGIRSAVFPLSYGSGSYPYAALVRCAQAAPGSQCLFTPYDLARVHRDPYDDGHALLLSSTRLLREILGYFDTGFHVECFADVPGEIPAARFTATAYPNPFNPRVRIDYTVARAGRLTVKIFDLRGRLVRVLLDEQVTSGGRLDWDGTDGDGAASASGVYFYEARMDNEVEVGKLALIR